MPETPRFGSQVIPLCYLVHCLLCGQHHEGTNHYCEACMTDRYDAVERDAKIRSYSGKWSIVTVCSHTEPDPTSQP